MNFHYKAFIAVIVITAFVFVVLKPLFLRMMSKEDFALRRNVWLYLTVVGFLSPDYWLFFFLTVPVLVFAARKDSNPAALYLFLLLALPPVQKAIPTFGLIGQVFNMDHLRVMSLSVLLPTAIFQSNRPARDLAGYRATWTAPDIMVIAYVVLQLLLYVPYESPTNTMRRAILVGLDLLLPYFVLSRSCRTVGQVKEAFVALAAAAIVLCPLAVLEMYWTGMLYGLFGQAWEAPSLGNPLYRGELMRAIVTSGHSIVFGNFCAIALCAWWVTKDEIEPKSLRFVGGAMVVVALLASLSRGPWLGALVGVLTITALGRAERKTLVQAIVVVAVSLLILFATPYGESLMQYVPFIGSAESASVNYRQRLLEISLVLIAENPFLGTPGFIQYMEELRQGQGIIDLVNGHAAIALSFGLIGLGLFLGTFGVIIWRCALRPDSARRGAWRHVGVGIGAAIAAALATLFTVSNYLSITYLYWSLAGLGGALLRLQAENVHASVSVHSAFQAMRGRRRSGAQVRPNESPEGLRTASR